jgi:hypothetical protein
MKPPLPRTLSAVPPTLHARLEIAKAIRTLAGPNEDELLRQRRAEIAAIRRDLEVLSRDIRKVGEEWLVLAKAQLRAALKKYSPNQPRVPAGNPDGGQWTSDGGNGSPAESAERAGRTSETRTRYAALETGTRTDTSTGMDDVAAGASPRGNTSTGSSQDQYAAITVERYDRTGDQLIDRTTDILFQTLLRYADLVDRAQVLLGKAGPALYGTLVHVGFAIDVRAQNLPGIGQDGVEQSFSAEDVVKYGANGSVRTDVIMKDASGQVIAIWDVKTGNAELTDDRRQEIREETGVPKNIPVIELHVSRGVTH